ncbi:hypothetical protein NXW60_20345 [Bacteroides fragilis]|nr:hypothetical protein NXW60_20345 [Bacteroides fragilis]
MKTCSIVSTSITVKLPALRERREDIPLLARHFADRRAEINNLPRTEFSSDALNFPSRLPFPGNIRELKNPGRTYDSGQREGSVGCNRFREPIPTS